MLRRGQAFKDGGEEHLGRRKNKCKGPEAGEGLAHSSNRKCLKNGRGR